MSTTIPHVSGAACPSCGRFVGPLEKCPFCGANIQKRLPLKYLKLACLVLAILGVAILVYAVSGTATPTAKIGDVEATMNYAYVRVEGTVTRGPIYDVDAQTLRFYVADETGEIQATAFRDVTTELVAQKKIPSVGDKISMDGTLRIRDDFSSLNVAAADKVLLTLPSVSDITIADIGRDDDLHFVRVRGDVRAMRQPYEGLTLITVGDASGEIDVAVSGDIEKLYGDLPLPELGDIISAQAVVTFFRDEPQLVLRDTQDWVKVATENTAAQVRRIGELDTATVGQRVRVKGQVEQVSDFSQGKRVTLSDASSEITMVVWQNVLDEIGREFAPETGSQIEVVGQLSEYRGALEIIPQRGNDITIGAAQTTRTPTIVIPMGFPTLTPDPKVTPTATFTPRPTRTPTTAPLVRTIGSITATDEGEPVIVTADVARASVFAQGARYTLKDGTGEITLLIWSDVLDKLAAQNSMGVGARVRVTGKVEVFNDTLEIIPARPKDIEILVKAVVTPLAVRAVNSISTDDLSKTILLGGTATEIMDFSAGKYVTLQDESGTVRVVVFKNVLEKIQAKLVVGAQITVRGEVNVFAGKFEVVAKEVTFP